MIIFVWILFFILVILYIFYFYKFKKDRFLISYIFLILSFFVVFLWLFELNFKIKKDINVESSDIVFVLDVSKSMLAVDYDWLSRLDISKKMIKEYVLKNKQNRYWLIIFAWDVVSSVPLVQDIDFFLKTLDVSDTKSILKWWTDFSWVIENSISMFEIEKNPWVVVMFSDFEDISWNKIDLRDDIKDKIKKLNISYLWYWVWKTSWSTIPEWYDLFWQPYSKIDSSWKEVITKLDIKYLKDFISQLNWNYHIVKTQNDQIDIKNIVKKQDIKQEELNYSYSRYFVIIWYFLFIIYLLFYYLHLRKEKSQTF